MDTTLEVNTKNIEVLFKNAPRALKSELADAFDHASRKFLKTFRERRLSGRPGVMAHKGGIFHRFRRVLELASGDVKFLDIHGKQSKTTSAIAKSFKNPLDMRVDIWTSSKVAGKYESGGDVSGGSKMMRVPMSPEAKARSADNPIQGLEIIKTSKGLYLVEKIGKKKYIFHYVLKHSVPIRRSLGFMKTWDELDRDRQNIFNEAITNAIAKA